MADPAHKGVRFALREGGRKREIYTACAGFLRHVPRLSSSRPLSPRDILGGAAIQKLRGQKVGAVKLFLKWTLIAATPHASSVIPVRHLVLPFSRSLRISAASYARAYTSVCMNECVRTCVRARPCVYVRVRTHARMHFISIYRRVLVLLSANQAERASPSTRVGDKWSPTG